ncbi:hypothetical protein H2200_011131 [Cladophialophora chaetospira]|uniref:Methyltransferase type 11 domain-containing protein n=1 Tax=Cladophialophora chaetospira TaxID=386627 RepID=A0AA39CDL4_9EURO|nr:hypothetical protein H2200_011131 [Cladophialophora chaetospira]
MFNIPFKNPLEAETVSERRERKARESEGSVRSSKLSRRPKLVDRGVAAKKVTIFRFAKGSKTPPAIPGCDERGTVDQDLETGPAELPGSPVTLASPSYSQHSPSCARPLSGLSFAPSVRRQEAANSSALDTADPLGDTTNQTLPQRRPRNLYTSANGNPCREPASSVDTTRIASPIQSSRSFIAQISRHRTERYPNVRYPSTSSTGTTDRSDASYSPGSTPGTVYSLEHPMSFSPTEYHHRGYTHTSLAGALGTPKDKPAFNFELPSNTVTAARPQDEHACPLNPHSPITFPLLTESLPSTLLLVQNAPDKTFCQRLNEDWEGTDPDTWKIVNAQKKVWALLGLKRIQQQLGEKSILASGLDISLRGRAEILRTSSEDGMSLLCISDDGVEAWLHAATIPRQRVSCLRPFHAESSAPFPISPLGVPTKSWTDMPALPYPDSSADLISAGNTPGLLRSSQWPAFVQECARVLRPGGVFEVSIIDPMPRNCGPLLRQWTAEKVILGLERRFLVTHPAMIIPLWLEDIAEFGHCESHKFSFPAVFEKAHERSPTRDAERCFRESADQRDREIQSLRNAVGRYFYEALYGELLQVPSRHMRSGSPGMNAVEEDLSNRWWWTDPAIVRECHEYGPVFEMITFRCMKLMSRGVP